MENAGGCGKEVQASVFPHFEDILCPCICLLYPSLLLLTETSRLRPEGQFVVDQWYSSCGNDSKARGESFFCALSGRSRIIQLGGGGSSLGFGLAHDLYTLMFLRVTGKKAAFDSGRYGLRD